MHKLYFYFLASFCVILFFGFSTHSKAGVLLTGGARWDSFSFEPKSSEATPNYFGYGAMLEAGYSVGKVFDMALWGSYTPGRMGNALLMTEDAVLGGFGGTLALRIKKSIYIAGRGGKYIYNIIHSTADDEIDGRWEGVGGGASIGALFGFHNSENWQVSFDWDHSRLARVKAPSDWDGESRVIDSLALTVTYVLNMEDKVAVSSLFFGSFIDSIGFLH